MKLSAFSELWKKRCEANPEAAEWRHRAWMRDMEILLLRQALDWESVTQSEAAQLLKLHRGSV